MSLIRFELRKTCLALFLSLLTVSGHTQQLHFSLINKSTILDRVKQSFLTNEQREREIKQLFDKAGCGSAVVEEPVKHVPTPNVICRLQGDTDEEIIVGAHYDKVRSGTGTIDNWSGAALLPSLYQALAVKKPHHTFIFVAFTGEEEGLLGSDYFGKHISRDELARSHD